MEISMPRLCERLSKALVNPLTTTWTSVVSAPGSDMPVLTATGLLQSDGIYFEEEVQYYGFSRKFEHISEDEIVTSAKVSFRIVGGPALFVETLI